MKLGWIGLGNMGVPMATNLINAGYQVSVYNRTREKAEPLLSLGARFVDKPKDLFAQCDVLFTMVSDDEAVKTVYTADDGILSGAAAGKIAVDMSTVSPSTSRYLAEKCRAQGVSFLDAPVSGSVQPAKEGKLIVMVGGAKETFDLVKPMFDKLGKMALYLGENGAGSNAKLAINLLLGITGQGIAESILFARQHGISAEDMLTIISESAVGTPLVRMKAAAILADDYPAAFALKHMAKDLRLAQESGAAFPLAESAFASYQSALRDGLGDLDFMAIMRFLGQKTHA
jgi:3-hydroxyisobutyrate dehydrogenase